MDMLWKAIIGLAGALAIWAMVARIRNHANNNTPTVPQTASPTANIGRPADLLKHYSPQPRKTGFFGDWSEFRTQNCRIAFQAQSIFAGEFNPDQEQITDIYLIRANREALPKPEHATRLDRYVQDTSPRLAQEYTLGATGRADYAELRKAGVSSTLLGFSSAVTEVMIFEESRGVQLQYDFSRVRLEMLEQDLKLLIQLYQTLKSPEH